jgi:hypothetical protein
VLRTAALMFCKSVDLASRRGECILDRAQHVIVAPIIGRLVADDHILGGRNRHPNVDTINAAMAVLRARRDDGNAATGDVVFTFLQASYLVFDCRASSL